MTICLQLIKLLNNAVEPCYSGQKWATRDTQYGLRHFSRVNHRQEPTGRLRGFPTSDISANVKVSSYRYVALRFGQELHASPHIEHTPHIVLSIYIHIWNVLSIYGYVGYHEVLTRLSNQAGKITLVPVNFPGAKPIMKLVSLNDVSLQRTREKRKGWMKKCKILVPILQNYLWKFLHFYLPLQDI